MSAGRFQLAEGGPSECPGLSDQKYILKLSPPCKFIDILIINGKQTQVTVWFRLLIISLKIIQSREFPGGPVARSLPFTASSKSSIPAGGTKILQAVRPKQYIKL